VHKATLDITYFHKRYCLWGTDRKVCIVKLEIISRYPENRTRATPLLFVHGAFMGAWVWAETVLPSMAQHGYEAHAVSLRGHGQSEGRERLSGFGLDDYVEDIEQAVGLIGSSPVLVGHSMGGAVVQRFMRRHELPGVVLMASVPPQGTLSAMFENLLCNPMTIAATGLLQSFLPRAMLARPTRRAFFSQNLPDERLRKYLAHMQPESHRAILELTRPIPASWQPREGTPMLVIGGERDTLVPEKDIRKTADYYGTSAWICPNVAHVMFLETHWRDVTDHLIKWLNERVAARA
jgi:pimeloyl-ACP methyl ester carboxylesterase